MSPSIPRNLPPARDEHQEENRRFVAVWMIISTLWIAAALVRIHRGWAATFGWASLFGNGWFWVILILPAALFGAVFAAIAWRLRRMNSDSSER